MKSFIEVTSIAAPSIAHVSLLSYWCCFVCRRAHDRVWLRKIHVNIYLLYALRRLHHYGLIFDAIFSPICLFSSSIREFAAEKNLSHVHLHHKKTSSTSVGRKSFTFFFYYYFLFNFYDNIAIIRTNHFQSITIKLFIRSLRHQMMGGNRITLFFVFFLPSIKK